MLAIGDRVSAFQIDGVLGTGGMGTVYRATHVLDDVIVALKVPRDDQLACDHGVERAMREATILASVQHRAIPRLHECGLLSDGRPWIAMDLVEGASLASRIRNHATLSPRAVLELIGNVSDVLATAHECGFTHRDLKPDNIILSPDDPVSPIRVIDWGIAHEALGLRFTAFNEAVGTPIYMSPEQARGGQTTGLCDVYGLGVVAYQALSGSPPFTGGSAVDILVQHLDAPIPSLALRCPEAPVELVELVEWMLVKRSEVRPSAVDVRAAVGELRAGRPLSKVRVLPHRPITARAAT